MPFSKRDSQETLESQKFESWSPGRSGAPMEHLGGEIEKIHRDIEIFTWRRPKQTEKTRTSSTQPTGTPLESQRFSRWCILTRRRSKESYFYIFSMDQQGWNPFSREPKKKAAPSATEASHAAREARQQMLAGQESGLKIISRYLGWDTTPKWMKSKWFLGGFAGIMIFLVLATDRVRSLCPSLADNFDFIWFLIVKSIYSIVKFQYWIVNLIYKPPGATSFVTYACFHCIFSKKESMQWERESHRRDMRRACRNQVRSSKTHRFFRQVPLSPPPPVVCRIWRVWALLGCRSPAPFKSAEWTSSIKNSRRWQEITKHV